MRRLAKYTLRSATGPQKVKIGPVLSKFASYCEPRKNIPFEGYRLNRWTQEVGESYDQSMMEQMKVVSDNLEVTVVETTSRLKGQDRRKVAEKQEKE